MTKTLFSSFVLLLVGPAVSPAADLSRYRDFQFGTTLPAVVKQTGAEGEPKTLHLRPALIQQLDWRPRPFGPFTNMETVESVGFTFYEGSLFRITVLYDRYQTEGLTSADIVEAVSAAYGLPVAASAVKVAPETGAYGEQPEVIGKWEDSEYSFELIRSPYGPTFKLTGSVKALEAKASVATAEAKRLDDQEAPQRDAARRVAEAASAQEKLDKARLVNKRKFRP